MFYREDEFEDILQTVVLVPYSPGYKLGDITQNSETPSFYKKNGFVYNEKENKHRSRAISMRYDVFQS